MIEEKYQISLIMNDDQDKVEFIVFPVSFIELDSRSRTKLLNKIKLALYDEISMNGLKASGIEVEIN